MLIKRTPDGTSGRHRTFPGISRLLALAAGGYAANRLALDISIFNEGPPDLASKWMPLYRHGTAFSWLDRNPALGFLLSILSLLPSFAGMILVWFHPRAGFLVAAAGWGLVTIVPLVHFFAGREGESFDWNWKALTWILLPAFWLLIAAFRDSGGTRISRADRPE